MNKEIIIYTSDSCGYCKKLKELLDKEKIEFTERPSKNYNEDWQRVIRLTGLPTFPTIVIGDEYYVAGRDFGSQEQFVNYLKNYTPINQDEFPLELKLMQGFKTMAFSINSAMSKVIQQLNRIENEHKSTD